MSHKYFKVLFLAVGFSEPINDLHIMWNSWLYWLYLLSYKLK